MINHSLQEGWKGFLSFSLVPSAERTVVKDKRHYGPLVLQRPYYQEINRPSILIIHPPGGIAGGDILETSIDVKQNAKGLISTPAATKFYRSNGATASQIQSIQMQGQSELEWLPQETLFFNQSYSKNRIVFNLQSKQNKLIAWDIVGLGRPFSGEFFKQGQLFQSLELYLENELVFVDRLRIDPTTELLKGKAGFNEQTLFATALIYSDDDKAIEQAMSLLQQQEWSISLGVTQLDNLIVLRALDDDLDKIKEALYQAWCLVRPSILGLPVIKPRIWNT